MRSVRNIVRALPPVLRYEKPIRVKSALLYFFSPSLSLSRVRACTQIPRAHLLKNAGMGNMLKKKEKNKIKTEKQEASSSVRDRARINQRGSILPGFQKSVEIRRGRV